jgi:hypothetical protein
MSRVHDGVLVAGRYRLRERIGQGGVGTVWRADDTRLHREVAVKEVRVPPGAEGTDGAPVRERLMREAHAAARVADSGAVTVYDVIDEGDHLYLVMELVEGESLAEHIRRTGPVAPARAAAMLLPVLGALDAAHRVGVVHRDVKPSNVLLATTGAVKLADFGIASLADDPRLTRTGTVLGSPSFMAPEQASGRGAVEATDLWGLGATLYAAVEGREPFTRDSSVATVAAVVHEEPPMPVRARELTPLIGDLLHKEPERRPPIDRVRRALEAASGSSSAPVDEPGATAALERTQVGPVVLAPMPTGTSSRRDPRRWLVPVVAVLLIAGLVAAIVAAAGDDEVPAAITATTGAPADQSTTTTSAVAAVEWVTYTDPATGFALRYPSSWSVERNGTLTDFTDPESGTFLRVDWTDEPGDDPVQAWRDLSADFAEDRDGYEEIRIEPTTFKGFDAAIWEFRFDQDASVQHAQDLGMVTGDYGFALFFVAEEQRWDGDRAMFEEMQASFEPPTDRAGPVEVGDDDDDDD